MEDIRICSICKRVSKQAVYLFPNDVCSDTIMEKWKERFHSPLFSPIECCRIWPKNDVLYGTDRSKGEKNYNLENSIAYSEVDNDLSNLWILCEKCFKEKL